MAKAPAAFPFTASMTGENIHLTYDQGGGLVQAWNIPRGYVPQLSQLLTGCTSSSKTATASASGGGGKSPRKASAGRKTAARSRS